MLKGKASGAGQWQVEALRNRKGLTMSFPPFFEQVPAITMFDPLTRFLGAGDGTIRYTYADAARLAGHSCPTIAGTWLMLRAGLARLWPEGAPLRGAIHVYFPDDEEDGTTGVMAAVASLVTGARGFDGFKGIAGRFDRRGLLHFAASVPGALGLKRVDTGAAVALRFDAMVVPSEPEMRSLLQRWADGTAEPGEEERLGALWQDRVRRILVDHADDSALVSAVAWPQ